LLNPPARAQPGGDAGDYRRARQHDAPVTAAAMAHQVDWTAPIRCRRPRQPQLGGAITKLDGRFRQAFDVDAEQRVEGLDLDVEPLHQRHRHRPQIRKATANRHLHDGLDVRTDGRQKFRQLIHEPGSEIIAPLEAVRRRFRRRVFTLVPPRQLACGEQRAVANERDARSGCVQGDIRLDRARHGKRLPRSRQPEERVGGRADRSNADAGFDERPHRG
jgi:hypothetical protein